jgi:hypothetical protein
MTTDYLVQRQDLDASPWTNPPIGVAHFAQ